jgi:sterol desaturase/sphingolipid hydroxylase (fatty acid hydroxylase superfamily)
MTIDALLLTGLAITLAVNGLTMELLERAFYAPRFAAHHFRAPWKTRATDAEKRRLAIANVTVSLALLFGSTIFLHDRFVTAAPMPPLVAALRALGGLALYDFLYYFLHRAMHHRKLMRWIHAIHHGAKTPSARESLYAHPVEIGAGLSLFIFSMGVVGPLPAWAFLGVNFVYSTINIVIHSGIEFPSGPMRLFNYLARKHHGHHGVDMNKNYASVSPLWDIVFRTSI